MEFFGSTCCGTSYSGVTNPTDATLNVGHILFCQHIILALIIIMVAINTASPLDFSSFPIVILFATTMRLGLNVASTRLVLLEGHKGGDSAAGKVIEAFGQFVIGGNYAVGFIVFAILMIINFIVITKGAGRVSEVIARFTLDALPGKQMAIDADLNAGVIDQDTARDRRAQVSQESDFYGSMDGASKFVRGDAVAGLLILMINLIGGLAIGMLQHDLTFGEASKAYLLLTIGDGLVAQLPALNFVFSYGTHSIKGIDFRIRSATSYQTTWQSCRIRYSRRHADHPRRSYPACLTQYS